MQREFPQSRCQAAFFAVIRYLRRSTDVVVAASATSSSVGNTQSIGMELHRSVGQPSRNGPFPRVPPAIRICEPAIILPQTRQKRLSSNECHSRNLSSRRNTSSLSASGNVIGG